MVNVSTPVVENTRLTAADRCDRCGAQAHLRVSLASGGTLLFCAHHARAHAEKIKEVAVRLEGDTSLLGS
ncbi:DUF7455 domain-containing protein [Propionibacterium ruminifibrarum]|uniref:DUF7455 domain-containing protein n=1 Tax=Propionibacterium ruminifibrarum TaxID=1962131 RepID=UPI003B834A76